MESLLPGSRAALESQAGRYERWAAECEENARGYDARALDEPRPMRPHYESRAARARARAEFYRERAAELRAEVRARYARAV